MRLYSTRESIDKGEISLLAIVETLLAVLLLLWLSLKFDTTRWLAVAVCLAPLMLLRTKHSVQQGLRWYTRLDEGEGELPSLLWLTVILWGAGIVFVWRSHGAAWGLVMIPSGLPVAVAGMFAVHYFCIRCGATLVTIFKHPLVTFGSMPQNWRRIVLAEDSATDPEFVPGKGQGPAYLLGMVGDRGESWVARLLALLVGPPLYALTAVYRWTVKATCLIFLPLIWLVETVRFYPERVREALRRYEASDLRRIWIVVTAFIMLALAIKVFLMMTVSDFGEWWNANGALRLLKHYIVPHQIPWWQLASAVNGVLAISLWLYARHILRQPKHARIPERTIILVWRAFGSVSVVLTLYTIACTVLITWKAGNLPDTLRRLWSVFGGPVLPE